MIDQLLSPEVVERMKDHARECFPEECCGLLLSNGYMRVQNVHENPKEHFRIDPLVLASYYGSKSLKAIVHSHVEGDAYPSKDDMIGQVETGLPWIIVTVNDDGTVEDPFFWGDTAPMPDFIGRDFRHGVTDCYALMRDVFRKDLSIETPVFPRQAEWWSKGEDMLIDGFEAAGFVEVPVMSIKKYDVLLFAIRSEKTVNHVGVYLDNGLMIHHLYARLSRTEPVEPWSKHLVKVVRHKSLME